MLNENEDQRPTRWLEKLRGVIRTALDTHASPPPGHHRLWRFLYGAALPFAALRELLREPAVRARYLRITVLQLVALLGVAGVLGAVGAVPDSGGTRGVLAIASVIYGTLCVAEAIVLALSRDYQDALSLEAAARLGVPGEPLAGPPRVRVDFAWLRLKLWRRLRAAVILASGAPLFAAVLLVRHGRTVYEALGALWTLYWLIVFALGSSSRAWETRADRDPWFLRGVDAVGALPLFGWPFRLYARLWRRWLSAVVPVCRAFEEAPYEAMGLALARAVAGFPGLYLFIRPMFPAAATHALLARIPDAREAPPVELAPAEAAPPEPQPRAQAASR